MTLYASIPARRLLQVLADLGILVWVWVWVKVGYAVHDTTLTLAEPGRTLVGAGAAFRERMTGAGESVDNLPILDDRLAEPLRSAAGVGGQFEDAGRGLISAVERTAVLLGVTTAVIPVLIVGGIWLLLRGRFVRRASAAQRFIDAAPDLDLFALRAMANQPMSRLARISDDPAGAWRRQDPDVIRALAAMELRESGLRVPG